MERCDYCDAEFEPRKMGPEQRFCAGGKCKKDYEEAVWRLGKLAFNRRRAAKNRQKPRTENDKLDLFTRSIQLARELEAAGHKVTLITKFSGEVLVDLWPHKGKIGWRERPWHYVYGMILLNDQDGDPKFLDPPSRGTFNNFEFQVKDEVLSYDQAAALLMKATALSVEH